MSSAKKAALIDSLGKLVVRWQDATQKFDEAVGEAYDLNANERHCLSYLWQEPRTASAIAREVRLTPAAVTALIDRLERRGYVRRESDPGDRRKVMVRATDAAARLAIEAYGPTEKAGQELLARYTEAELEVLLRFAREALALQEEMTRDFLARHAKPAEA